VVSKNTDFDQRHRRIRDESRVENPTLRWRFSPQKRKEMNLLQQGAPGGAAQNNATNFPKPNVLPA
jgi:hypothetical protein